MGQENKHQKVYVVTSGVYSGYGIDAIFSTPELANKYCDVYSNDHYNGKREVTIYDIDAWNTEEIVRKKYATYVGIKTGRVEDLVRSAIASPEERTPKKSHWVDCFNGKVAGESYVSQEHARKIAFDYRTRVLAEQAEGLRDEHFCLIDPSLGDE